MDAFRGSIRHRIPFVQYTVLREMEEWCLASIKTNARLRWEWDFAVPSPETRKEGDLRVVTMTSVNIFSPLLP